MLCWGRELRGAIARESRAEGVCACATQSRSSEAVCSEQEVCARLALGDLWETLSCLLSSDLRPRLVSLSLALSAGRLG